jgi:uncharacterized protein (TIGR00369 family)
MIEKMNNWQAADPDFKSRIIDSFQRQPFMQTLGIELVQIDSGYCEMKLPFKKELTQQHGYFHAGTIATIADNSAGYAAFSLMQATSSVLTVEFKVNLLSPGQGDSLLAKARVIKNGRTLKICQAEVFSEIEGEESLCAIAIISLMELENRSDKKNC